MTAYEVHRYISVFEKAGENHVSDIEFNKLPDLRFLQTLFNVQSDNPMYDVGVIDEQRATQLAPFISSQFDLDRFDYFLECDRMT